MAVQYQISSWLSSTAEKAFKYEVRKRKDAALNECWKQIFDMISGNAGRDTKRGWQLKHEFDTFAEMLEREGMPRGTSRYIRFVWRNDPHGICEHVEFYARRD